MDLEERVAKLGRKTDVVIILAIVLTASGWVLGLALAIFFPWLSWFGNVFYPAMLLPIAMLALVFLTKLRVGEVAGPPRDTLAALAHRFRIAMFKVAEEKDHIVVEVKKEHCVKVRGRASGERTEILVQADLTPFGWSIALIMILLVPFVGWIIAAWYSITAAKDSYSFAVGKVLPILLESPGPIGVPSQPDVKASLIDSLSEGYRLASEARDGLRSNYEDKLVVIVVFALAAIPVGALLWVASSGQMMNLWGGEELAMAVPLMMVGMAMWLLWFLHRKMRPRIAEIDSWASRLNDALAREVSQAPASEEVPGSLELLLDAWQEVPGWLKTRKEAGTFREPGTWLAIFVLTATGVSLVFAGAFSFGEFPGPGSVAFAGGTALVVVSLALYLRWRHRQEEESSRIISEWKSRFDTMMSQADGYIKGL